MSQIIKLQEEELQNLKSSQNQISQLTYGLGQLEVQKANLITQLGQTQTELNKLGKDLQEKYGEGSIDLETGELTLTEAPESTE